MRILADENVPRALIHSLSQEGHDLLWVAEHAPGMQDREVMELARTQGRMLLTFDKDFGALALREGISAGNGILLVRGMSNDLSLLARQISQALALPIQWVGHFAVLEDDMIRVTPAVRAKLEPPSHD
jgi:predicted nuclease of predicted toxin-antitoxin system